MVTMPDIPGTEILRIEVGSSLHGINLPGNDDLDLMGVTVEPPRAITGLYNFEQVVWRTAGEGERSGPNDIDLTVYGLKKWMRLAVAGNPSIILLLYAPADFRSITSELADELIELRGDIVSHDAGKRFLGYLHGQRQRAIDGRRGRRGIREGRSEKWTSHMLRLGYQGIELLTTGTIQLPMPTVSRETCLAAKRGDMSLDEALLLAEELEHRLKSLVDDKPSVLPKRSNVPKIEAWMYHAYQSCWREHGAILQAGQ